jgi:hypothetical protein
LLVESAGQPTVPGEPSRTDTLMGEMEAGVPQEEIAAKVTEICETNRRCSFRSCGEGVTAS